MALQRLSYVAALLSLASVSLSAPTKRDTVTTCLQNAQVPVSLQNTADWTQDGTAYNLRVPIQPAAIVVPTSIAHIAAAVSCGVQNSVPVSAKGGGHSYTSLGFGGEDGHLVIEMNRMFNVVLDNTTNVATVQPGARLGHLANELYNQGQRAFSHGTCPGVGVFGHSLHGGYGLFSHKHGLAVDWIVGATVVLANATVVHCSETENTDLFWAIRGAGDSFGIVAELEFNTFAAPEQVTYFEIQLNFTAANAAQSLLNVQTFIKTSPAELTFQIAMTKAKGYVIVGAYLGDEASFRAVFDPLLAQIGGTFTTLQTSGWLEQLAHFAGTTETDVTTTSYSAHDNFYASSMLVPELTLAHFESFVSYLTSTAFVSDDSHSWFVQMDSYGGETSAVSAHSNAASAFAHRDKLLLFQLYDYVATDQTYPASGVSFVNGFRDSVTSLLADGTWGVYANYPDQQLTSAVAQSLYWGVNLPRLQQIKAVLDPTNLFRNPQSIEPAS